MFYICPVLHFVSFTFRFQILYNKTWHFTNTPLFECNASFAIFILLKHQIHAQWSHCWWRQRTSKTRPQQHRPSAREAVRSWKRIRW